MTAVGYALSSEEHGPDALVEHAARAERAGFDFASISDHFHPWIDRQGEAPFVWSTLGAIARETDSIEVGTGVTCPTIRLHPAVVAHAAATAATQLDGRFFFGVGTGEALNEHVTGDRWPPFDVRMDRLEEAVAVVRDLWTGEEVTHRGEHFTVENARLYTLPDETPPIYCSATGPVSATRASAFADGLISTAPNEAVVDRYRERGEGPRYGQVTVCYAETEREARRTAREWWPNAALPGELGQELPTPAHFEQAASLVDEDDVAETVVCGPDPDAHVEAIRTYADAGFDHVYVHQVGPEQAACCSFYEESVLPRID